MNYNRAMEDMLAALPASDKKSRLLLHVCCAPCASVALERLCSFFDITLFYYNPNIFPLSEYDKRLSELHRLLSAMSLDDSLPVISVPPDYLLFTDSIRGLEYEPEGAGRCSICFELRLRAAASFAQANKFDFFASTLTTGTNKNAETINSMGLSLQAALNIRFLTSDFKKRNGFLRSIQLSERYNIYRQNYCGCSHSRSL